MFNFLRKHSSKNAIIFLQETHSTTNCEKIWTNQWGSGKEKIYFSHGTSNSTGVLIAFREGLTYRVESTFRDLEGHFLILKAIVQDSPVILINYYAPNDESSQVRVLQEINRIVTGLDLEQSRSIIWGEGGGGDFNLIFDSQLDSDGGNLRLKSQSLSKLISMMSENELCDIFRVRNPDVKRFTWRNKNPYIQRRLDYFILSEGLQDSIEIMDIIPSVQSDHSVLKLKISPTNERTRGPSSWEFNNSLVHDSNSVEQMKLKTPSFYQESLELSEARGRWEYMKYKMRDFFMTFSKQKAYQRKKKRIFLENRVKTFETKLATSSDEEIIEQYNMAKNELESIYNYITEGIILRSKASWYEHGEKSTQCFLNLEKRNKAKSHLRRIFISQNVETTNPDQIMSSLKSFYSTLYKRRSEQSEAECLDFLGNLNIPKLSDDDRSSCESKLTLNECWEALKSMGSSKVLVMTA